MPQPWTFSSALCLSAFTFAAPSAAQEAAIPQAQTAPAAAASALDTARVEIFQGRGVIAGGGVETPTTLRRDESMRAQGAAHLELPAGARAKISWTGTADVEVFGPASLEWAARGAQIGLMFHELSWVDMTVLRGEHAFELPAQWHGRVGRSSFRLRGIGGGPTELFLHAGSPIVLEWRGSKTDLRPPLSVFPGSSVRLDRPRFTRTEDISARANQPWNVGAEDHTGSVWPWRTRSDTDEQVRERMLLSRETQTFDEVPGAPTGTIDRVRSYGNDGASRVQSIRSGDTSAQVSIEQKIAPRVTVAPRRPDRAVFQPEVSVPATSLSPLSAPFPAQPAPVARPEASQPVQEVPPQGQSVPANAFDRAQWRGLQRSALNGSGVVGTERGTGVEVRVLGEGRTKVFISGSSPAPRWCFTPFADYLLQPGAVAVLESNGRLRMSFGTIEEHAPSKGRPNFDQLAD